jgi:hypothetical protein
MKLKNIPILICAIMLVACDSGSDSDSNTTLPPAGNNQYSAFSAPEPVHIEGYTGDAMEPFLSRDGQFLFFNDDEDSASDKDLYYAGYIDDTHFTFLGEIVGINTNVVDGVPTMDNANNFFWVSTSNYTPPVTYDTLFSGTFDNATGEINGVSTIAGLAEGIVGHLNFDLEVSPDGSTLYFVDGVFSGNPSPDAADIAIGVKSGNTFTRHPDSGTIMANINTGDLEYAPAISDNGLELFFTRLTLSTLQTKTYRAIRSSAVAAFQYPREVSAITGFAEAPTFSPDEKSLYFHKLEGSTFVIYKITRP